MKNIETCEYHTELASDIAVIKNSIQNIEKSFSKHIDDAEKQGGYRDRLSSLEQVVSALKKAMWCRVGIAGLIGGLIGSGSADAINVVLKWIMKS